MSDNSNGVAVVAIVVLVVIAAVFFYMMLGEDESDIELDIPDIDIDAKIGHNPLPAAALQIRI